MGLALLAWGHECLLRAAALARKAAGRMTPWLQGESPRGLAVRTLG